MERDMGRDSRDGQTYNEQRKRKIVGLKAMHSDRLVPL